MNAVASVINNDSVIHVCPDGGVTLLTKQDIRSNGSGFRIGNQGRETLQQFHQAIGEVLNAFK